MKIWNWIVADRSKTQIIFVGACVLSYVHTLNLFERSGYEGVLSHIGTIICELMFLLGITSKSQNRRTRVALGFGGFIVLYSNVSFGLAKGKAIVFYRFSNGMELNEVILCGVLIPLLVWIAEWVSAYQSQSNKNQADETLVEEYHIKRTRPKQADGQENEIRQSVKQETFAIGQEVFESDRLTDTSDSTSDISDDSPSTVAERLAEQEGKLPSIRRLSEVAGVSRYQAEKVLRQLKMTV